MSNHQRQRGKKQTAKKKGSRRRDRSYTSLAQHTRVGKTLHTGLSQFNVTLQSWSNVRLPEMLWAVLLIAFLQRGETLDIFRRVARIAPHFHGKGKDEPVDVTLSRIETWPAVPLAEFLDAVMPTPAARLALRPMLLFEGLPLRLEWEGRLEPPDTGEDWERLAFAVSRSFWHQSEDATDCRWVRLMFQIGAGRMKFPPSAKGLLHELNGYPTVGDIRAVRPTVRAMEGAISRLGPDAPTPPWAEAFWDQCHRDTQCVEPPAANEMRVPKAATTLEQATRVYGALAQHCSESEKTTGVDAKHNIVFGAAMLAVAETQELMRIGNDSSVLGRGGLRMIVDLYITLAYLIFKDRDDLWGSFRSYGAEQAKLAFLKLAETETVPSFASPELLRELANEDFWQEYVTIRLGHWDDSDTRKMSLEAGVKEDYDRYYGWTSVYVHSQWGAMRDVVFQTCFNPLHRLHRIPRPRPRVLEDVVPDACEVTDKILDLVNKCYPGLAIRLSRP